jgi:hypothetical protein
MHQLGAVRGSCSIQRRQRPAVLVGLLWFSVAAPGWAQTARQICLKAPGMSGTELDQACEVCQKGADAEPADKGEGSTEHVEWLTHLAKCRGEQGQWVPAFHAIERANALAKQYQIKLETVDVAATYAFIAKKLPQIRLELSAEANVQGLKVRLGGGEPITDFSRPFVADGPTVVEVWAPCRVSQNLTATPTAGTPAIVPIPVLAPDPSCGGDVPHEDDGESKEPSDEKVPVLSVVGVLGISVGAIALVTAGGAAVYKAGINTFACDGSCNETWSGRKEGATGWVNGGLWTALVAGGIGAISLPIGIARGEDMGSGSSSQAKARFVAPVLTPQAQGIVVGGTF